MKTLLVCFFTQDPNKLRETRLACESCFFSSFPGKRRVATARIVPKTRGIRSSKAHTHTSSHAPKHISDLSGRRSSRFRALDYTGLLTANIPTYTIYDVRTTYLRLRNNDGLLYCSLVLVSCSQGWKSQIVELPSRGPHVGLSKHLDCRQR